MTTLSLEYFRSAPRYVGARTIEINKAEYFIRGLGFVEKAEVLFGEARLNLAARMPDFPALDDADIRLTIGGPDIEHFRSIFDLPGAATGAFSAASSSPAATSPAPWRSSSSSSSPASCSASA